MSQGNRDGKRTARERTAAMQAAQARRERQRRQVITAVVAVVVILAVVGIGVWIKVAQKSSSTAAFVAPTGAVVDPYVNAQTHTNDATGILYGSPNAKVTMTVFEDVRCPFCDIFELGARDVYKKYVDAGEVKVYFHLVKLIDENDNSAGGNASGSRNGGSALACAQNEGLFDEYHDVIYDNQPDETTDPWASTAALITLAKKVPGLDTPTFESCVNKVAYGGFVDQNWADFNTLKLSGTPTVEINGTSLSDTQLFSSSSTAGVTATTSSDGEGANTTAVNTALQSAVTSAYGSSTPTPWASASSSASSSASASATSTSSAS